MITTQSISTELFVELDEPTDISPTLITLWLTENIGKLNLILNAGYIINPANSEYSPELGENEKSILKQLYFIYYYTKKLGAVLSSADSSSVVEITEAGGTIRLLNKNELAKTYMMLKNAEQLKLKDLVSAYKLNNSEPLSVDGTDILTNNYNGSVYYNTRQREN